MLGPEPERGKRQPDAPAGVICWDMKRFSRNERDSDFFRADLRRRGYEPIFISDRIPPGDMAPTFESMLSWKAQQDLEDLSKDISRGLRDRVLARGPDGRYLNLWPTKVPAGFRGEPYHLGQLRDGRPRVVQRLVPDKGGTWEQVARAFALRAQGAASKRIHEETDLFRTYHGYDYLYRRRLYCGDLEWAGTVVENWIEPCVAREVWDAVQERRAREARDRPPPRAGTGRYMLSGWIKCGICGGGMGGSTSTIKRAGGVRYRYRRYKCTRNGRKLERHVNFYPPAFDVERSVIEVLAEEVLVPDALFAMLDGARIGEEEQGRLQDRLQRAQAEADRLDAQIGHLVDQVERFGADAGIARRLRERRAQQGRAEARLHKLERRLASTKAEPVPGEVIRAFCDHTRDVLLTGSVAEVRDVLRTILEWVVVWPDGSGVVRYALAFGEDRGQVQERKIRWCRD